MNLNRRINTWYDHLSEPLRALIIFLGVMFPVFVGLLFGPTLIKVVSALVLILVFASRIVYALGNPGKKCSACGRYL